MILHIDKGLVYLSKPFNDLLQLYYITHSMSRAGTPINNASMEAINGWLKEELFTNFAIRNRNGVILSIKEYIHFFNYERPAFALNYMTQIDYKNIIINKH